MPQPRVCHRQADPRAIRPEVVVRPPGVSLEVGQLFEEQELIETAAIAPSDNLGTGDGHAGPAGHVACREHPSDAGLGQVVDFDASIL